MAQPARIWQIANNQADYGLHVIQAHEACRAKTLYPEVSHVLQPSASVSGENVVYTCPPSLGLGTNAVGCLRRQVLRTCHFLASFRHRTFGQDHSYYAASILARCHATAIAVCCLAPFCTAYILIAPTGTSPMGMNLDVSIINHSKSGSSMTRSSSCSQTPRSRQRQKRRWVCPHSPAAGCPSPQIRVQKQPVVLGRPPSFPSSSVPKPGPYRDADATVSYIHPPRSHSQQNVHAPPFKLQTWLWLTPLRSFLAIWIVGGPASDGPNNQERLRSPRHSSAR